MGILDKIKNLFTDEEEIIETQEIEVDEPVIETPPQLPTFMREKIEKEEKKVNILEEVAKEEEIVSDRELASQSVGFKFPIAFDEKDFEVTSYSNQNIVKREKEVEKKKSVSELYSAKKEEKAKEKKHTFRPTPIISPVYGILDKNYKKEEVKARKENAHDLKRTSKTVDFESVRMKAYGTLTDEISDNLLSDLTDVNVASNVEVYHEDELLDDIKSTSNEMDTIGSVEENYYDFGVTYEVSRKTEPTEIEENKAEEIKIVNHNDEEVTAEKIEVKEEIKPEVDSMELTDDLFNLIDSMYEERDDL